MTFDRESMNEELLQDYVDEFETKKSGFYVSPTLLVTLILVGVTIFLAHGWYTDKFAISSADNKDVPLIRATQKEVRVKPADPGGMQIANRDKRVYETISGNINKEQPLPKVTRLMPEPEKPVARETLAADDSQVGELLDDMGRYMPDIAPASGENQETMQVAGIGNEIQTRGILDIESSVADNSVNISEDETLQALVEQEKKRILQALEEKKKDIAQKQNNNNEPAVELAQLPNVTVTELDDKSPPKTTQEGTSKLTADDIKPIPSPKMKIASLNIPNNDDSHLYKVQLGSFKSAEDVDASWKQLQKKYSSLLGNLSHRMQKADLGNKGVFYRLKVGPFTNVSDAQTLCQKLREKKQGCLFVRN